MPLARQNGLAGRLSQPSLTVSSNCKIIRLEKGEDSKWTETLAIKAVSRCGQASWLSAIRDNAEIGSFKPGDHSMWSGGD